MHCVKTLFVILLSCFCLSLAAPLVHTDAGTRYIDVGVHVAATHSHSLSEAELVEIEDLEDPTTVEPHAFVDELNPDWDPLTSTSSLPDRYNTVVSETPRYIRVRHLQI